MSSAPSQASRRRSSPTGQQGSPQAESPARGTQTPSLDAEVIVLNDSRPEPPAGRTQSTSLDPGVIVRDESQAESAAAPETPAGEVRRCWVCMGDETDDTPENNIWRSPCPCSLTAHEACLLEWLADKEAPPPGQIAHNHEIKCPQCQAPIKIQRPREVLVSVVDVVQRTARVLILPTALCGIAGCFYSGFVSYGANAMAMVFGTEAADALLAPVTFESLENSHIVRKWFQVAVDYPLGMLSQLFPFFPRMRSPANIPYFLGLPLIAPSLVVLRTSYGDLGFSLLMPLYFLNPSNRDLHWPPPPGLAFATIPYLRTAYHELYKYTFADLEKKWDLAVQRTPREGETAEQIAAQAADEEEHAIFELEIVREVEGDAPRNGQGGNVRQAEGAQNQAQVPQGQLQPGNNPPVEGAAGNGNNAQDAQQPNQRGWQNGLEFRQDVSATLSAGTIMGAIFFPAVAAAMGEVLKVSLPAKWVGRGAGVRVGSKGLLMEKWGRSLVGGCLFVVLKDVVTLYCKWRKAKDFGKRKVMDYVGKKEKRGVAREVRS